MNPGRLATARFVGKLEAPIFPMTKSLAHQLAEYACSLKFEDLSKDTVHEVKRRVIDSFGCALGAWNEELAGADLGTVEMSLEEDGREVSAGVGANALGHPAEAVAWLAETLLELGVGLRAGDIVLSGALGPLVPLVVGGEYTLRVGTERPLVLEVTR